MVIFKLEQFPNMCRMCLKPSTKSGMFSLDKTDPTFDGSVEDFITAVTFEVAEHNKSLLPRAVCQQCLELLKFFAKFRTKLINMHLLMNSLVELKNSNTAPITDLFRSKSNQLALLFKDLDLCTKETVFVEDLINEFPSYYISRMGNDEEGTTDDQIDERLENDSVAIYAEECTANELAELMPKPLADKISKCARNESESLRKKKNKTYPCSHSGCTKVFDNSRSRSKHYQRCHKPHVCDICGLQLTNFSSLSTHKTRHMNLLNHCCIYCGHRVNTKTDLRNHINSKHNAAYFFSCEVCGLQFKRKSVLVDHMKAHSNERKYKCSRCDKRFLKLSTLKRHEKTVHENIRIPCDHCPKTFLRREVLRDHIEYVHGIQTRFVCNICLQVFFNPDSLETHKLRHDSPKELECPICLAVFDSTESMKGHLCISYRDDYICCGRDFWYHGNYNKHMFIKHGVRTNARVKPDPDHLLGYLRSTRKRIETCPKCEATFTTRKKKQQHLETCVGPDENVQEKQETAYAE